MTIDTKINLITSIGTLGAVLVALGISVIPAIWRARKNRLLAERRVFLSLKTISKAISEYRYYNPTEYQINVGEIHYSYSPEKLKIPVKIDINRELDNILACIDSLKQKDKLLIWSTIEVLKEIISGFPKVEKTWDKLEESLNEALNAIPIGSNIQE